MFEFRGPVSASKSWLNRVLIIQHFYPQLKFEIASQSDDVLFLNKALNSIGKTNEFELGQGGTSFRFFAFLISRNTGVFKLKAHPRLFERPQSEIISILNQLGVRTELNQNELLIHSRGWQPVGRIHGSSDVSSQFISGLLLSGWNLDFDLEIEIKKPLISFGYLKLTTELLNQAGMKISTEENEKYLLFKIPKKQKVLTENLPAEIDMSSAFALAAAAVVGGKAEITNWTRQTEQPDYVFSELFKKMNIRFETHQNIFTISRQNNWKALEANLNNSPDLFPVLAVLCAFADGVSVLNGAAQLKHKESDRIKKTRELLDLIGVRTEVLPDGMRIFGKSSKQDKNIPLSFNPDHDHRMAMAAALVRLSGFNIIIEDKLVVNKSYPNFWADVGLNL